jgi:hypothetical protein
MMMLVLISASHIQHDNNGKIGIISTNIRG